MASFADTVAKVNAAWGEVLATLPPDERELAGPENTNLGTEMRPNKRQLKMASVPPGYALLGVYVNGGKYVHQIDIFHETCEQLGEDPADVVWHELTHRLGYDHTKEDVVVAQMARSDGTVECSGCTDPSQPGCSTCGTKHPVAQQTIERGWGDSCPACMLHSRVAEADRLMAGLRMHSQVQHRIPPGLGGTIPLARQRIAEARGLAPLVGRMVPNRRGEVRSLETSLGSSYEALGAYLDEDSIVAVAKQVHQSWQTAYTLAWAVFAPK
jgi:hypothetical protein